MSAYTKQPLLSRRFLALLLLAILHFTALPAAADDIPTDTAGKGVWGEGLMDDFATSELGWEKIYDPTQSKIANYGKTGGNGFDGVYMRKDPVTGQMRIVIADSKVDSAKLSEFYLDSDDNFYGKGKHLMDDTRKNILADSKGNPFTKKRHSVTATGDIINTGTNKVVGNVNTAGKIKVAGVVMQGSEQWITKVVIRMVKNGGYDRDVGATLSQAILEKRAKIRVDFLEFHGSTTTKSGTFELGQVRPAVSTAHAAEGGVKGRWVLKDGRVTIDGKLLLGSKTSLLGPRDDGPGGGGGKKGKKIARKKSVEGKIISMEEGARKLKAKKAAKIPKLKTKNKMLRQIVADQTTVELRRIGNGGSYLVVYDIDGQIVSEKVGQKYNSEYMKSKYSQVPEKRRPAVLKKLMKDRTHEIQKARGQILWGEENALTIKQRTSIIKTRGLLESFKNSVYRRPNMKFTDSLKMMGAGGAASIFGPMLIDASVAWYDDGWQAGIANLGMQGTTGLGLMLATQYSPLLAAGFHLYVTVYWPVIAFHVVNGALYVVGNLIQDYLVRDNFILAAYLEPGTPIETIFLPRGTQIPSFFDSPYGIDLDRNTLHTKYKSLEEIGAAVSQYKIWLVETQPVGVTGPILYATRDDVIWQRVFDLAKADWFESMAQETQDMFEIAEQDSKDAYASVERRSEVLKSLSNKEYEGAEGFIFKVDHSPLSPKLNEAVTINVKYAVAGVYDEPAVVDLVLDITGPTGTQSVKLLDAREINFNQDDPLRIATESYSFTVPVKGTYSVTATVRPEGGTADSTPIAFATQGCMDDDKVALVNSLKSKLQTEQKAANGAATSIASALAVLTAVQSAGANADSLVKNLSAKASGLGGECTAVLPKVEEVKGKVAAIKSKTKSLSISRKTAQQIAGITCELATEASSQTDPAKAQNLVFNAKKFAKRTEIESTKASGLTQAIKEGQGTVTTAADAVIKVRSKYDGMKSELVSGFKALNEHNAQLQSIGAYSDMESYVSAIGGALANAESYERQLKGETAICAGDPLAAQAVTSAGLVVSGIKEKQTSAISEAGRVKNIYNDLKGDEAATAALADSLKKTLVTCNKLTSLVYDGENLKAIVQTSELMSDLAERSADKAQSCVTGIKLRGDTLVAGRDTEDDGEDPDTDGDGGDSDEDEGEGEGDGEGDGDGDDGEEDEDDGDDTQEGDGDDETDGDGDDEDGENGEEVVEEEPGENGDTIENGERDRWYGPWHGTLKVSSIKVDGKNKTTSQIIGEMERHYLKEKKKREEMEERRRRQEAAEREGQSVGESLGELANIQESIAEGIMEALGEVIYIVAISVVDVIGRGAELGFSVNKLGDGYRVSVPGIPADQRKQLDSIPVLTLKNENTLHAKHIDRENSAAYGIKLVHDPDNQTMDVVIMVKGRNLKSKDKTALYNSVDIILRGKLQKGEFSYNEMQARLVGSLQSAMERYTKKLNPEIAAQ